MNILVDTSALISLFRFQDPLHQESLRLSKALTEHTILITNYIFAETVTILSQKEGKKQAISGGEYLKRNFNIIRSDEGIEELAWDLFKKQTSKNISYVDCTTFALYQKGVFNKALAFDIDFKKNKIPLVK